MSVNKSQMKNQHAKFLQGSIFKHVMTMSVTNAVGISALFIVDLVDIFFISWLNNPAFTAAIGYASSIIFFTTSICIALVIANNALVAKSIGQYKANKARRYITHLMLYAFIFTALVTLLLYIFIPQLLSLLGARGETLNEAINYLRVILPSLPILALAMQMGASLRALGDAKCAMYATLAGGIVNALLDPLFIFSFNLELTGAALATLLARISFLAIALFYILNKHKMLSQPYFQHLYSDFKCISNVAFPALLTQIATPLSHLYVIYEVAKFGTGYVAGWAIIGRIIPVAFVMLFAISGAIAPIIGQNYGALNFTRVREVLNQSLKFITSYTLVVALFLSMGQDIIVDIFQAKNETAEIIRIFCQTISITFIFTGITFVSMSLFNNLGYTKYATLFNFAKILFGTIPFVSIGAFYLQAPGILYGQAAGSILFAFIALRLTHIIINHIEQKSVAQPVIAVAQKK